MPQIVAYMLAGVIGLALVAMFIDPVKDMWSQITRTDDSTDTEEQE